MSQSGKALTENYYYYPFRDEMCAPIQWIRVINIIVDCYYGNFHSMAIAF